jgi:tetratricopeptide (TPR) repeat protein
MAKKQDRTEDRIVAVEEALSKTERFIEENQKLLTIIVGVIIVLVLGFFGFKRLYIAPREAEAREQMFMAEKYFEIDSLNLALNGDGMYPGFLEIIDDYGITRSANLAHYYTGIIYLRLGNFEEAIDHLKKFKSKDQVVSVMATGAIGDAYMEMNELATATSYYVDAAEMRDNEFSAPVFYLKAGMAYELQGKYGQALKMYETIKYDFPTSNEAREIDKYIAKAKGLAGEE